jgi:hypothetical protein
MKFQVTMKDPDTLHNAIREASTEAVAALDLESDEEREAVLEARIDKVQTVCSKWFEYGEYLTVEIDTDAGTCVVMPK